jgi:hypothetical protein
MLLSGTASGTVAFVGLALLVGGVLLWQRRRMEEVTRRLEQRDEYRRLPARPAGEDPSPSGASDEAGESGRDESGGGATPDADPDPDGDRNFGSG